MVRPAKVLFVLFLAIAAHADAAPAVKPAPAPEEHLWQLTTYLKGTTSQVRDLMNGESERLIAKVKETDRQIVDTQTDIRNDERAALKRLHEGGAYRAQEAATASALSELEAARKAGGNQHLLDISSRWNRLRQQLQAMDRQALSDDKDLANDKRHLRDLEHDLAQYKQARDKALAWRNELLDDTRNGFRIKGPVQVGSKGIFGPVKVKKVLSARQVLVEYEAPELLERGKEREGIPSYNALLRKIEVLVSEIDTSAMKEGQTALLDRNFIIVKSKVDDMANRFEARPLPAPCDELLAAIVPLREGAPATTRSASTQPSPFGT